MRETREIIISELSQAWQELVRALAHYLPRVAVMIIIAVRWWSSPRMLAREHPAEVLSQAVDRVERRRCSLTGRVELATDLTADQAQMCASVIDARQEILESAFSQGA